MNAIRPVWLWARRNWLLAGLACLVLGAGTIRLPDKLYVQSLQASLLSEPRTDAGQLATASRGDRLEPIAKKGRWYRVRVGSIEAWVHELLVGNAAPMSRVSILGDDVELGDNARRRASEITSAAASRGLTEAARENLGGTHSADYDALSWLEQISRQITESPLEELEE